MSDAGPPDERGQNAGLTAAAIASLVAGKLTGDGGAIVHSVAPLARAGPGDLSFLADLRYAGLLDECNAGVLLVAPEFAASPSRARATVVVAKPHDALVQLLPRLYAAPALPPAGLHPTAVIGRNVTMGTGVVVEAHSVVADGAVLGPRVWVGPQSVVGAGVSVGADTRLVSQVTCYPGTEIGARVIIHAGVRLGSDGFGYSFADGQHKKILHVGRCIIADDVEIGANSTIDRGSIDDTVIGAGTKIDNLVHVAHNVRIGRLCLLMAQVGVAGSTHVDDGAILAGQAGISGHIRIGAGARIAAQAGVISDVPPGETWSGYPARPHKESMRASAALLRLSGMLRRIEKLLDGEK